MAKWPFERKLFAAFALVAAVAGLTAVVDYRASLRDWQSSAWVAHTREVEAGLRQLEALTTVGLRGVRGFLITGQESYLEPYRANRPRVAEDLAGLRVLTADNAAEQGRLQELADLEARQLEIQDALGRPHRLADGQPLRNLFTDSS